MKRLHLFEFEDFGWLPASLRDTGTDFLRFMIEFRKPYEAVFPRLIDAVVASRSRRIIDLCSGGGGPIFGLIAGLDAADARVPTTLSDLFPSRSGQQLADRLGSGTMYERRPIDATHVPADLRGFRTLFTSFHHFAPAAARQILADAVASRQPIGVFELTERSLLLALLSTINIPLAFATAPFNRPFRWSRLFWTYTGIGPALVGWDGAVSCLRTHTLTELTTMVAELPTNDYQWQIGAEAGRPVGVTYLIGVPGAA